MSDATQNLNDLMVPVSVGQQAIRTQLQQQESSYRSHLSGQTDAPYIGAVENFEGWSHQALYTAAQSMSPSAVNEMAGQWGTLQTAVMSDVLGFQGSLTGLISEHWEGDAADAASAAVAAFARSGTEFTTSLHTSVGRLEQIASAAQEVKVGIQPPLPPMMSALPVAPKASELAAEAERQAAVRVMQAIYTPTYVQAGTNVPTLPPPRDVVNGGLGVAGPALGGASPSASGGGPVDLDHLQPQGSAGGAPGPQGSADPASPGSQDSSTAGSPSSNSSLDSSGLSGQSHDGSAGQPAGGWSPADTSSASATPLDSLSPASTGTGFGGGGAGGGALGGGAGYGSIGSGFGGGSLGSIGGLVAPGPGGDAMAGRSAPVAGAGPASTVASGAAGRPTTRGSMSGLARGAQHGGEDDEEYRPASYLVSIDNGNELVGELPMVVPPVIGATED